jgi:integrase
MAITEYQVNGVTLYKIYVNVKSRIDPLIRVQKRRNNFATYKEAEKEETRITKESLIELGNKEKEGDRWDRIIELWYYDQYKNDFDHKYTNKFTLTDYYNSLQRYTKDWLKRKPSEITRGDARSVIENLTRIGKSKSYIAKVKNTINLVFQWGIDHRHIRDVFLSPMYGIKVDKREDKFPEILNLVEIRKFLYEAKLQNHIWYPIWAMALLTGMRSGELYALE